MRIALLALSVIFAVALMGFGPNPQAVGPTLADAPPPGRASGRAAVGVGGDDDSGAVMIIVIDRGARGQVFTIITKAGPVPIVVDENTRITVPWATPEYWSGSVMVCRCAWQ
jgi:hypothetical protein